MIRQVSLLSTLFVLFVFVNVVSAQHLNELVLRDKKIHVILDELDFYAAAPSGERDKIASGTPNCMIMQKPLWPHQINIVLITGYYLL
jgi:hypothetical protein